MTVRPSRRIRVLVAKPGLDGHDRGARVIASALRDAGMEVVYTGLRATVPSIAASAEQESVDVIGLSILSGAHLSICERLFAELKSRGVAVPIVVGGVIPAADIALLSAFGVAAVFGPEAPLGDVVRCVETLAAGKPWTAPSLHVAQAPRFGALDHVAICVRDMDAACGMYERLLKNPVAHREYVDAQKTHAAFFDLPGGVALELVSPGEGNVGLERFLEKRGDALHHLCFRADAIGDALSSLRASGVPLIDNAARPGARGHCVAFLHPKAAGGVLIELLEHKS